MEGKLKWIFLSWCFGNIVSLMDFKGYLQIILGLVNSYQLYLEIDESEC